MLSYFSKKMNQKGFTLIELIVVIAIIGILIAIAVPRLGGFTNRATDAANDATERTLDSAYAVYQADDPAERGNWPADYIDGATSTSSGSTISVEIDSKTYTYTTAGGWQVQ